MIDCMGLDETISIFYNIKSRFSNGGYENIFILKYTQIREYQIFMKTLSWSWTFYLCNIDFHFLVVDRFCILTLLSKLALCK